MSKAVLISQEQIDTSVKNAVAYRVTYNSSDVQGKPTVSSGLVIAPAVAGENRKVMSWAHGTTGLGDAACPSAAPDPASELKTYFESGSLTQYDYGVPGVQSFIDEGWVVCATDYQGLGTPGIHQYTVSISNARDTVNIVHAAREMNLGAGKQFGVMGWSQGGAAAAAAAELGDDDFKDLTLVGSVPFSPGVAIIAIHDSSSVAPSLTAADIPPDGHLFMILAGMAAAYPETLSLSDVFTPVGIEIFEKNWNIQPVHHLSDILSRAYKHAGQVMAPQKEKLPAWLTAFAASSATRIKPVCPIFVTIDSQRGGTVCPVSWQTSYVDAITKLGGDITSKEYPNDDHFSLPQSCIADAKAWLGAQFS